MGQRPRPAHPDAGRPDLSAKPADYRRPAHPAVCGGRPGLSARPVAGRRGRPQRHARGPGKRPRLRPPSGHARLARRQRTGAGHRCGGA
ncbi:hypothetical protein G6F57_023710 [Rhizopus arrhizus]|nr:hypothetical protein G6F62_015371 [Rhizopus arrhizus]KAG1418746.1 hypothetical protein G6F57_023710 [Rhizopus arrhizus]